MLPETLNLYLDPAEAPPAPRPADPALPALADLIGRPLAEVERLVIEATLARHGGSVSRAARVLDLSPSTLYRKIEAWAKH
jgi:DNA-binding NtrC family response regulator